MVYDRSRRLWRDPDRFPLNACGRNSLGFCALAQLLDMLRASALHHFGSFLATGRLVGRPELDVISAAVQTVSPSG